MRVSRRDLLLLGAGAGAGAGLFWLARKPRPRVAAAMHNRAPAAATRERYGHGATPPMDAGPRALDRLTIPPQARAVGSSKTVELSLEAIDQSIAVSSDHAFEAWTFGGSVPGPVIRATEGDRLVIRFANRTAHPHNLHFHGRHEIEADGWEPVPPGGSTTYELTAGPFGLHPYHCDLTPAEDHITNGLYGLMIVDPPPGRPKAHEFVLVLGGFDLDSDGKTELFGWNGVAGFFAKYPIKVPAGELVRLYILNMVMDQPVASFHLHAETFSLYRSGTGLVPDERTDLVMLGPAERAIVEFTLPRRGRYMFHPHQRIMAERGAMGWVAAV